MIHPSDLTKESTYQAEHPQHGRFTARLIVSSSTAATFRLEPAGRSINPTLFLLYESRGYVCLYTGDVWTINP